MNRPGSEPVQFFKGMKYLVVALFTLALGVCFTFVAFWIVKKQSQSLKPDEGLSVLGENLGTPTGLIRIPVPVYLQKDPKWGSKQLGPSSDTIAGYGCTLCSMAMALGSQGFEIAPDELNNRLMAHQGFTENSLLIWGAIEKVTSGQFTVEIQNSPDHDLIDGELAKGNPLIAKVLYDNRIYHWVLVTGKDDSGYLIADPLGSGSAHGSMADYPSGICAVRYLKKP